MRRLRELGDECNLRDPRKLLQIAQRQGVAGATTKLAKEALASDVGRQILRPPPRATGKAAATRPDSALQADLIDFSNNLPPNLRGQPLCRGAQRCVHARAPGCPRAFQGSRHCGSGPEAHDREPHRRRPEFHAEHKSGPGVHAPRPARAGSARQANRTWL